LCVVVAASLSCLGHHQDKFFAGPYVSGGEVVSVWSTSGHHRYTFCSLSHHQKIILFPFLPPSHHHIITSSSQWPAPVGAGLLQPMPLFPRPCSPHPHAASFTCLPASSCRSGRHGCTAGGGAWCSARLDGDQWLRWDGGCDRGQRVVHSLRLCQQPRQWLLCHGVR